MITIAKGVDGSRAAQPPRASSVDDGGGGGGALCGLRGRSWRLGRREGFDDLDTVRNEDRGKGTGRRSRLPTSVCSNPNHDCAMLTTACSSSHTNMRSDRAKKWASAVARAPQADDERRRVAGRWVRSGSGRHGRVEERRNERHAGDHRAVIGEADEAIVDGEHGCGRVVALGDMGGLALLLGRARALSSRLSSCRRLSSCSACAWDPPRSATVRRASSGASLTSVCTTLWLSRKMSRRRTAPSAPNSCSSTM